MSDSNETANLLGQLAQGYHEHLYASAAGPEIVAVPGRVIGGDIEGQADALADAAARLAELLAAFSREPRRSMDAIAVFRGLSRHRGVDGIRRRRAAPSGMVRSRRRGGPGGLGRLEGRPRGTADRRGHLHMDR